MSEWIIKTNAQTYFVKQGLRRLRDAHSEAASVAIIRELENSVALVLRELWLCWVNEIAEIIAPKQTHDLVTSLQVLENLFGSSHPEVERLLTNLGRSDSWVAGFVELESNIGILISDAEQVVTEKSELAIDLKSVEMRALSVSKGIEDMSQMYDALSEDISLVRQQQTEW